MDLICVCMNFCAKNKKLILKRGGSLFFKERFKMRAMPVKKPAINYGQFPCE